MSSISLLQFVWPTLQIWFSLSALKQRLREWSHSRWRRPALKRPNVPDEFSRALEASIATISSSSSTDVNDRRVRVEFNLTVLPPLRYQPLLLELSDALVEDAIKRSLSPFNTGCIFVALRRMGNVVELIVEDDGWQERSQAAWLADNQVAQRLTAIAGGSLRRKVDWATNQAIVSFPV